MTPERFEELKTNAAENPDLQECLREIEALVQTGEHLVNFIDTVCEPTIEKIVGNEIQFGHRMASVIGRWFSRIMESASAENFLIMSMNSKEVGEILLTVRKATGKTLEETLIRTDKNLDDATDELHTCRQIIAEHLKGSEDERVMEQLTLHVLSQEFTCPKCGGHYFGRDTKAGDDGKVVVLDTVHCNGNSSGKPFLNCDWTGVWPAK